MIVPYFWTDLRWVNGEVEEEDARLALLQTELGTVQNAIRNLDATILQIKGWCVTASLAIGGFAITSHRAALVLVGEAAVLGFFMINCQFRAFQRDFMNRNLKIDTELRRTGIMEFLRGRGTFEVMGTAATGDGVRADGAMSKFRSAWPRIWFEICRASNYSIYAFLAACLLVEGAILSA
jgi:hypothetical protein